MSELVYYDLKESATMVPSLPVQVSRELGRRIVAGTLEPDSMLDHENSLAERFKVSRVVIRDAVKILVGKGLLEVRRGFGTRVKPRSEWVLLDDDVLAWHLSAPPDAGFLAQLMEFRLAFEPRAARWAAERATAENLAEIEAAVRRMEEEKGSVENFIVADARFHRAVLHAAHNELLRAMGRRDLFGTARQRSHYQPQTPGRMTSRFPTIATCSRRSRERTATALKK